MFTTSSIQTGTLPIQKFTSSKLNKKLVFRDKLHQGVLNDIERRQRRKAENVYNLQKQLDMAKDLRKAESSSNDLT